MLYNFVVFSKSHSESHILQSVYCKFQVLVEDDAVEDDEDDAVEDDEVDAVEDDAVEDDEVDAVEDDEVYLVVEFLPTVQTIFLL